MATFLRIWKPTVGKLLLTLGTLTISAFLRYSIQAERITELWSWGFPLAFYEMWGPCTPEPLCRSFEPVPLLVDLLFWYVFSAVLIAGIGALRWIVADIVTE